MSTPDTVQLSEFTPTTSVAASDLVYSANGTTGVEKATTVAQLQTFIQSPIANSTLANAGALTGAETFPLGKSGLFQTALTTIASWILNSFSGFTQSGAGAVARTVQNKLSDVVSLKDFGAKGDGVTDDSNAVLAWLTYLCTSGGFGTVPAGTYLLTKTIQVTLNASIEITCSSSAVFVAATGFPANYKLFQFLTGTAQVNVLKWMGGQFDGTHIPNSTAGQSNDIFGVNATNVSHVRVELDRTTAGLDWLASGADSHLFIAGGSDSIIAHIGDCVGAWDCGIYISRDISGAIGGSLKVTGNFSKCSAAINVKRQFERAFIQANVVDCLNGVGSGVANITGTALATGGDNYTVIVNSQRTENAAFINATRGVNVMITATDIGVALTSTGGSYVSTQAAALRIIGSTSVAGTVVANGVNALCTSNANFNGVRTEQVVITSGTYQSTDNLLTVVTGTVGRAVKENDSSDRNTFVIKDYGSATAPTLLGTNSTYLYGDGTPRWQVNGGIMQVARTYATLPATAKAGDRFFISDATVNTFRAVVSAGGGTYQVYVYYSAGSWVVG
jgi:hypothetical protein